MAENPPPYNPYPPEQQQGYPPPTKPGMEQPAAPYPGQPQPGYPPQQPTAYPPQQPTAYPPQQPTAYPPPQPQVQPTQVTVVTQQPVVVQQPVFKTYPVTITLENGQQAQTRLQYRSGILTWLVCCAICWIASAFGLICGLFGLVAFCINDLKDVYHLDPSGKVVGVYKRI